MPSCCPAAGLQQLKDLDVHGCRNIVNLPGHCLPGLPLLTALTSLSLRNCDGLQDGALSTPALAQLHCLDLSGKTHFCIPPLIELPLRPFLASLGMAVM